MYLSINHIKNHLNINIDYDGDDQYLTQLAITAENVVQKHIDVNLKELEDGSGGLPSPLLQAMLFLIGTWYASRESVAYASTSVLPHAYDYIIALYKNYNGSHEGTNNITD